MSATEFAALATSLTVLLCAMEWVKRRWGDWTLNCIIRVCECCDQHLTCGCPHHDVIIHEEMARVT